MDAATAITMRHQTGMIRPADSSQDLAVARELFVEYAAESQLDLCFQHFEEELAGLPGDYAPPNGRLLLAWLEKQAAGCVAMRGFDKSIAEMKRLYVRPAARRSGLGRGLAVAVIGAAKSAGYQRMRLDTLDRMKAAVTLYESLGFQRIEAYRHNPLPDAVYLELIL